MSQDLPQPPDSAAAPGTGRSRRLHRQHDDRHRRSGPEEPAAPAAGGHRRAASSHEPSTERGWWMPSYQPSPTGGQPTVPGQQADQLGADRTGPAHRPGTGLQHELGRAAIALRHRFAATFHSYPPPPEDRTGRTAVLDPKPPRRSRGTLFAVATVAAALVAGIAGGYWASSMRRHQRAPRRLRRVNWAPRRCRRT